MYRVVAPFEYSMEITDRADYRGYNVVPFRTIKLYLSDRTWNSTNTKIANVFGNIALFMPFGFLFPLIFRNRDRFKPTLIAAILLSVFFEVFQLLFGTGFCDIDDVLLNTTGGVFGYLFYRAIYR